jgi:hypothetical protein
MVERVLAGNAGYRATCIASAEAMRAEARNHPAPRENRETSVWCNCPRYANISTRCSSTTTPTGWSKLPALGERTPHEAVRDHDGREAVAVLVAQIERDGGKTITTTRCGDSGDAASGAWLGMTVAGPDRDEGGSGRSARGVNEPTAGTQMRRFGDSPQLCAILATDYFDKTVD